MTLRRDVVSGLVIVAPLTITVIAVLFLLRFIAGLPLVARVEPWFVRVPLVIGLFVVLVLGAGYFTRTTAGATLADALIDLFNRIPGLRVVFNATHLAVETAVRSTEGRAEPVRIEAWPGLRVTAFTTGNRAPDGRLLCFFPTAPNISTGYVIEVEEDQIEPTGERVEEALTRLISAGFGDGENNDLAPPNGGAVEYVRNVEIPDEK